MATHTSIPVQGSIEVFEHTQISPFVSYSKVKVFYVGHNRNGTYIGRDEAQELGSKLPGSPVVGNYDPETGDFGSHDRDFGYDPITKTFKEIDLTKAYGFVPPNAQVWFQKFEEEGEIHEYVCTECYIWTGIYPESQRIVDKGNNQSMELKNLSGNWAEDSNTHRRFFIINEAIVEKLCILGENHEPCFEGAQFRTNFSLHDEFEALKQSMYSLMQDMIKQGGLNNPMNENDKTLTGTEGQTPETEFEKKPKDGEKPEDNKEGKTGEGNTKENKDNTEGSGSENKSKDEEDPKKKEKKYNLDEVVEYQALKSDYATLQRQFAALQEANNSLTAEIEPLRTFKAQAEKTKKETLINSFYMLSDEDKSDVVANIDKYSYDEIEAKLAVIGMRNKVNFGLSQEAEKETPPQAEDQNLLYNLQGAAQSGNIPAWIKAVQETEKNL